MYTPLGMAHPGYEQEASITQAADYCSDPRLPSRDDCRVTPFVIASNATKFQEKFGMLPDLEDDVGKIFGTSTE